MSYFPLKIAYLDNIQIADGLKNHENPTRTLSPNNSKIGKDFAKDKEPSQSAAFSDKKIEKKTSLLPPSCVNGVLQ